jgi:hypothetical protein
MLPSWRADNSLSQRSWQHSVLGLATASPSNVRMSALRGTLVRWLNYIAASAATLRRF